MRGNLDVVLLLFFFESLKSVKSRSVCRLNEVLVFAYCVLPFSIVFLDYVFPKMLIAV